MSRFRITIWIAALVLLTSIPATPAIAAGGQAPLLGIEVSAAGGAQFLNKNDTGLTDNFINIPVAASVGYRISPIFGVEGEFAYLVPIKKTVDLAGGTSADRKTPNILTYQLDVLAHLPLKDSPVSPYLAAGAGAMTWLKNTDGDRIPTLGCAQTMFAMNFGAGASYALNRQVAVRADFREFAGFPADDAEGLSLGGSADPVWMERGTLGVLVRF